MVQTEGADFLPNLTRAFTQLDASTSIKTADFAEACAKARGGGTRPCWWGREGWQGRGAARPG